MYCPNCGNKKNISDKYCGNCGLKIQNNYQKSETINNKTNKEISVKQNNQENLSIILGILALCFISNLFISLPLSIISVIIGKKANKGNTKKAIGWIIGTVALIISVFYLAVLAGLLIFTISTNHNSITDIQQYIETENWLEEFYYKQPQPTMNFDINGYSWKAEDNSIIYLENNKTYIWYEKENVQNDNFYEGTYETYSGKEALSYLSNHSELFGIPKEELNSFFNNNFQIQNYYVLILKCEKIVINREEKATDATLYYYGTYDEINKKLLLVNHLTATSLNLIMQEKLSKIDI